MIKERFTFLCTKEERKAVFVLANYYHLSQSDVIRLLLHNAAKRILTDSVFQSSQLLAEPDSEIAITNEEK